VSISQTEVLAKRAAARATFFEVTTPCAKTPVWLYPASAPSQGSILFVHGYRGTHEGLEPIVGGLESFDCYVPELPGFGEAEPLRVEHNLEHYCRWLTELIKELNLTLDVSYFGHSFGSVVLGKYLAVSRDETRTVLLNPVSAAPLRGPRKIMSKLTLAWYQIAALLPETVGRQLLGHPLVIRLVTNWLYKGNEPALKEWIQSQHGAYFSKFASPKTAKEGFDASVAENLSEFAALISQPVLLLCGDRDDITSVQDQRSAAELYPQATYVEMVGTGHLSHYERAVMVAQHTKEFIKVNQ
jgi:pimeloyl-ACP methyl ester carboxylesterase